MSLSDSKPFKSLTEPLLTTTNNLRDVVDWLNKDAYVVIYSKNGRFFHHCTKTTLTDIEIKDYLDTHRFIYIDVSPMPGLLDDGEWNWYITHAGFDECECPLKAVSSVLKDVPYKDVLSLQH